MIGYVRPEIAPVVVRDESGRVIEYGDRWGVGSPPEETYSVGSHPERFAPLHTIADALIEHLRVAYDVDVAADEAGAADFVRPPDEVMRLVRVTPRDPQAATLTFAFVPYPGVAVHAGLLHDFVYPTCGCDACDETWESQADEMERFVLAVAAGRYAEYVRGTVRRRVGYAFTSIDGAEHASGELLDTSEYPRGRLRVAARRLATLTDGWGPWPLRAAG